MFSKKAICMLTGMALLLWLNACQDSHTQTGQPRTVRVIQPQSLSGQEVKSFSGIVQEAHEVSLGFKTAGQIESILVQEGDFVRKGQFLASLDDSDYLLGVEAAQIQYDQLQDEVGRLRKLYESKSVSGNDYQKALAGLEQLGIQLRVNQKKVDYTRLYAPADGYIQSVNFSPSEMVDAGTPLFSLIDMSGMQVLVNIPVDMYNLQDRIDRISCHSLYMPENMDLEMASITPKADNNQLYRMMLTIPDAQGLPLTAGMSVDVDIVLNRPVSSALTLPVHCLLQEQDKVHVFVLDKEQRVRKTAVSVDHVDDHGQAIVTSGLTPEAQVVSAGVRSIRDGQQVRIQPKVSETNVGGLL